MQVLQHVPLNKACVLASCCRNRHIFDS